MTHKLWSSTLFSAITSTQFVDFIDENVTYARFITIFYYRKKQTFQNKPEIPVFTKYF